MTRAAKRDGIIRLAPVDLIEILKRRGQTITRDELFILALILGLVMSIVGWEPLQGPIPPEDYVMQLVQLEEPEEIPIHAPEEAPEEIDTEDEAAKEVEVDEPERPQEEEVAQLEEPETTMEPEQTANDAGSKAGPLPADPPQQQSSEPVKNESNPRNEPLARAEAADEPQPEDLHERIAASNAVEESEDSQPEEVDSETIAPVSEKKDIASRLTPRTVENIFREEEISPDPEVSRNEPAQLSSPRDRQMTVMEPAFPESSGETQIAEITRPAFAETESREDRSAVTAGNPEFESTARGPEAEDAPEIEVLVEAEDEEEEDFVIRYVFLNELEVSSLYRWVGFEIRNDQLYLVQLRWLSGQWSARQTRRDGWSAEIFELRKDPRYPYHRYPRLTIGLQLRADLPGRLEEQARTLRKTHGDLEAFKVVISSREVILESAKTASGDVVSIKRKVLAG